MTDERNHKDPDLDAGLEAAFGEVESHGASILMRIERLTGVKSQLLLHDSPDEESPLTHVHRLTRDDEGAEDDSRYQVAGEIAKGGVGVVYKCRDRDLGRDVAVKVLRKVHAGNPEVFHRFVEEAQIGGQLQHPGIVPVYSLGLQPDGRPSFAMKLVKGRTLAAALKERKSPAEDRRTLLRVFERICQTMAYAHARGVIHRDLKPSNVMLGAFGEVLVVDWGFGKVLGRPEREETAEKTVVTTVRSEHEGSASIAGSVMGTPAYMPPEQALGHVADLDEQTDVFSLGAILCEILTGRPPYVGENKDLLVLASQAKLDDAFARLAESDADPEVAALAKRCLSPLRGDRPTNANEVADEMGRLLTQAEERAHAAELHAVTERSRVRQARTHAAAERKAKKLTIGIATATLVLIACGGLFFFQQDAKARELAASARPQVEEALEEVSRLSGQGNWDEALAEARKAEHLAVDLDDATRARVAALTRETLGARDAGVREAAQLEKDRRLLEHIEEIRNARYDDLSNPRRFDESFAKAYREYGIDMDAMDPEECGRLIAARGEDFALAVAVNLDMWSRLRRLKHRYLADRDPEQPSRLASLIDPNPHQRHLRELIAKEDLEGLIALAGADRAESLPVRGRVLLGSTLLSLEHSGAALELMESTVRQFPGDFYAHLTLSLIYSRLKRPDDSLRHLTACLALRPGNALAHLNLGCIYANFYKQYERAEEEFRTVISRSPEHVGALKNLGVVLTNLGRVDDALEVLERAHDLDPQDPGPVSALAIAFGRQGLKKKAIEWGQKAIDLDPLEPRYHSNQGDRFQLAGMQEKAIDCHLAALNGNQGYARAHGNLGVLFLELGKLEYALEHLRKCCDLEPESSRAHYNLGTAYVKAKDFDKAIESFELAVQLDAQNYGALANLGATYSFAGDTEKAISCHQRAINLAPDQPNAYISLALDLRSQGKPDEELTTYESAVAAGVRHASLFNNYGMALFEAQRNQEALKAFQGALECRPDHLGAIFGCASAYNRLGMFDEAAASYRKAIPLAPHLPQLWNTLGATLLSAGKFDDAAHALEKAVDLLPGLPIARLNLGTARFRQARITDAVDCFRRADELAPNDPDTLALLGNCTLFLRKNLDAAEYFAKSLELSPEHPNVRCNLGHALFRLGRFEEAVVAFREGHEQGLALADWAYPSAAWLANAERCVFIDSHLEEFLDGQRKPADAADGLLVARVCLVRERPAATAEFCRAATTLNPGILDVADNGYIAPRLLAIASAAPGISPAEQAALRQQAFEWIKADFARCIESLKGSDLAFNLTMRLVDPDLELIREGEPYRAFWDEVRATIAEARKED